MRRRRPHTIPPLKEMASMLLLFSGIIFLSLAFHVTAEKMTESEALMKLKQSLHHNESLPQNWNPSGTPPPCTPDGGTNWGGVICSNGKVWGLQLENMQLSGDLNLESWRHLPELRTISLRNNEFSGPFPYLMVKSLPKLRSLYLSRNRFSGKIPDNAFKKMHALRRVFLSKNSFSGRIPTSLAKLPRLVELRLEENRFEGEIPNFEMQDLSGLNVSDNQLEGPVPNNLKNVSAKAFAGNKGLCGPPLGEPCRILPPPPPSHRPPPSPSVNNQQNNNQQSSIKVESNMFLLMLCLAIAILLVLILVIAVLCFRRKQPQQQQASLHKKYQQQDQQQDHRVVAISSQVYNNNNTSPKRSMSTTSGSIDPYSKKGCTGKLVFVKEGYDTTNSQFDLAELLKASAEVLGSGNFGSAYKAVVRDEQPAVVVKRYRQMNIIGKVDFHEQMARMGRLKHPNVLPVVGYYYRKEEKLVLTEFVEYGSLANHLHGDSKNHHLHHSGSLGSDASESVKQQQQQTGLDWPTRLRILKGVARGLAYLDTTYGNSTLLAHGHLKSSNVLLNESFDALLCDHGLLSLINQEEAKHLLVCYKSPDFYKKGQLARKTDVWCLGILILEILTGTFPPNYLPGGSGPETANDTENLVSWVDEVASLVVMSQDAGDSDCNSVTDSAMGKTEGSGREIRKLLDIGLSCCQIDIDKRWTIKQAVDMIEQVNQTDNFSNNSSFASLQEDGVKLMELA